VTSDGGGDAFMPELRLDGLLAQFNRNARDGRARHPARVHRPAPARLSACHGPLPRCGLGPPGAHQVRADVYMIEVASLLESWPEQDERQGAWFKLEDAVNVGL